MKILGFEFGRARPQETAAPVTQTIARGGRMALSARRFDASFTDRLVSSWTKTDQTVNQSLHKDLRLMRARSRDFFRNNEYGRKFSSLVTTNIVGHAGFTLKVDCRRDDGSPDQQDSRRIKAAWLRFAKIGNYDVTGRLSEAMFDKLAVLAIARDGEVLIRKVEGRGPHGCQLQLVRGDVLDEELNKDLQNGHRIRMGVEFDAWMKPVAYYFRKEAKSADIHGALWSQHYDRIDAKEIIHLFILEEVDQWRGVPWAFAALRRARQLDQFNEAALVAANVGAAKMGFFQQKDPEAGAPMQQLSFQVSDVAASYASGINPMVIFAQQSGQVIQALGMMTTKSTGLLAVLGSPMTLAIVSVVTVLGQLYTANKKAGEGADDQAKKEKSLTERIKEQNESLQRNIELQGQRQKLDLATANSSFVLANNARVNLNNDIAAMEKQLAIFEKQVALGERGYSGEIANLKAQIATAKAKRAEYITAEREAQQAVKAASITIADRRIAGQFDKQVAETNRYEDALGKLNDQVRAGTLSLAERNRRATEELALHEKNKKAIEESTKAQRESNREASRLPDVTGSEVARLIGAPITSGKRSASQNKKAGGAANSYHLIDQAIDIPLTVNGKPLTKEGIRAALEPAGIVIKELLGPGDKGHSDHFHVAFARKRATADKIASEAAADAKKAQEELANALSNVTRLFDPAAEAAAQYRLQLQEIKKLEDAGVAGGGISAEDAKRYRDELAESHAAKLDAIEDARHAKFLGNMSKEFQLASELGGEVAEQMVKDYLETTQAAEAAIVEQQQEAADRQREMFLDLADFYQRAFETGGRSIWSTFKQMGRRVLAELAAQSTISLLSSGGQGGIGGVLGNFFGVGRMIGSGSGGTSLGGGLSAISQSAALGGIGSAAGPAAALISLNQGVAKALGADQMKNGLLASLVIGPILTKLFGSAKRGSATLAFTNGSLGVGATRGNSNSRISAAKDGIGSLADTLEQIAEALGGTISGAGSVSLGIRKKSYVVDPTGQGRTKGSGVLKFKDEQDAIEAAMRDALQDGVIDGISAASKKILASGQDLQKAIQKASLIESIPKALKARLNPLGAEIDALNEKWDKTIAALKEGGATAEQMAEAEKLYRLERQDALTAANDNLKEFINSLNFGSSSTYSLIDQSKAARAELDQYLGKINSGNFAEVDQQKYLAAAQAFLEIQRELGGSGTGWFNSVDELRTATQRLADGLAQGTNSAAAARDPFAELTATSTQATAEILAQHSGLLAAQSQSLNMIQQYLATMAGGNGFIGTNRNFLAAAV